MRSATDEGETRGNSAASSSSCDPFSLRITVLMNNKPHLKQPLEGIVLVARVDNMSQPVLATTSSHIKAPPTLTLPIPLFFFL
ncbi:hypothetical protein E2C01_011647 [Portunus trituberculatus]|uniref:Uncharacterized protein n=1 Tax=Portunus trituberculatus TaxID=210409 RepID=A0A5B7DCI3_PORTR|nr:hypothetical protein [Portunus trituberculatus]